VVFITRLYLNYLFRFQFNRIFFIGINSDRKRHSEAPQALKQSRINKENGWIALLRSQYDGISR